MHNSKKYLTTEQLLNLLESKGLKIGSKKVAKQLLKDIGYYKLINGYRTPFICKVVTPQGEKRQFCENVSIKDLYNLYNFDQSLKNLVFTYSSEIETMVKARMSDFISSKYGVDHNVYLSPSNFKPDTNSKKSKQIKFIDVQTEILNAIRKQNGKHKAITWYATNYGYYPFWVVSNILTFGTISLLYSKMKQCDQYQISKTFNLKSDLFENILSILPLFRNASAHNEIIYNFRTIKALAHKHITNIYSTYNIPLGQSGARYQHGSNDIFALIIIFKLLLNKKDFNQFISRLKSILKILEKKIDNNMFQSILLEMGIVGDLDLIKNVIV